ncbi:MAG: protein phosphatase 2C domain-containing protein [bacterium]|nr:protein phosphatase 2C domain-containing protein [bacterium]
MAAAAKVKGTDLAGHMSSVEQAMLYTGQEMTVGELLPVAGGQAAVYSRCAPDKETGNEDAAALIPLGTDSAVLVVADGMGGLKAGELASSLAVRTLLREVQATATEALGLRDAILNGIEKANEQVSALGVGAGTTLAAVEVQGRTIRPYHVGDSMILVVGQRGKIKFQTVSHSPVGYAVEAGYLDENEAMEHRERHLVSNMLGSPDMRIDVGPPITMAFRDTLIVASDGLSDNLLVDEIAERARKGPLLGCLDLLIHDSLLRMQGAQTEKPSKPDDLSLILFRGPTGKPLKIG